MSKYIDESGLGYLWGKIKSLLAGGTSQKAQSIPFGEVDSTSTATAFTATVEGITALEDGVCCYLKNTVITSAAATAAPKCWTLDINNLGAKPVYVTTAAATFSTSQFTLNYKFLFTYDSSLDDGDGGWYIGLLYNTNTTYSTITQAEIDAGTGTKARNITPKLLRNNFYTEDEVDGLIPTVPTKVSDLTNDAGYITGYTETDPTVPSWAKAASKPSYTASEVGALPDTTSIPTESTVSGWGFTKNAGTITGITMNGASKGTSGVVDLGTVITSHQDISGKEDSSNKVTSLSASSTDTQYPSAKAVYDLVGDIETILASI